MTRVLVVEDDPGVALGLEDDLRAEGYEVEVVRDGESALRRARGRRFDLLILDVMLPGRDGFEVCRTLRSEGVDSAIVMLTAKDTQEDKELGLSLGADDYVTKPFSPAKLRARIKTLLCR